MTDEIFGDREIADLLPFYATGRLEGVERQRVAAAIEADPELLRELSLILEERSATIELNEALGVPSRQAADRFFAALEAAPRPGLSRFNIARFVAEKLEALRPQTIAWGAMAACALLLLQAGIITHMMSGGREGATTYQSASVKPSEVQSGTVLLVAFQPTANFAAIQKVLEDNALSVVAGPAAGFYSLRVEAGGEPAPKVQEIIARLQAHKDVIRSVMLQSPPD